MRCPSRPDHDRGPKGVFGVLVPMNFRDRSAGLVAPGEKKGLSGASIHFGQGAVL